MLAGQIVPGRPRCCVLGGPQVGALWLKVLRNVMSLVNLGTLVNHGTLV